MTSSSTALGARRDTCCATRRSWRRWSASRSASRRRRCWPLRQQRSPSVDRRSVRGRPPHRTDRARRGGRGGARARDRRWSARAAARRRCRRALPASGPRVSHLRRPLSVEATAVLLDAVQHPLAPAFYRRQQYERDRVGDPCDCAAPVYEVIGAVRLTPRRAKVGEVVDRSAWRASGGSGGTRLLRRRSRDGGRRATPSPPSSHRCTAPPGFGSCRRRRRRRGSRRRARSERTTCEGADGAREGLEPGRRPLLVRSERLTAPAAGLVHTRRSRGRRSWRSRRSRR